MEKLRILHVIPWLGRGGAERLTVDICNELAERETDVTILNFLENIDYRHLSPKVKRVVIPACFVPSIFRKPVKQLEEYRKFLNDFKPHIIHSHLFVTEMVTRQVLLHGTAYVTHLHDNMPPFRNYSLSSVLNKSRLTEVYEKQLIVRQYRKCKNNFIAISQNTADYFKGCLPSDLGNRLTIMHNAIDFGRFCHQDNQTLKEPCRLVTTGNLVDKKNQIFLVDVVKILVGKGLNVHLDILGGEGPNKQKIQKKITDLGLSKYISMQGNVGNVESFHHQSHIYVHAAIYEPFGLAILEAMAAGLPCVMLDGKGNRDIARDGKNGYLVEENSPMVFAEKIEKIIKTPGLYKEMSSYAVSFAEKFDIKDYVSKLLSYYHSILK